MPPPPPPAPPPAPMAPPAPPGPSKKSGGKSSSSASDDRGALLNSIQHGARLKKTATNDRSAPVVAGNKPPANKFNTVAARPTSSGDRNLPSSWRGSRDDVTPANSLNNNHRIPQNCRPYRRPGSHKMKQPPPVPNHLMNANTGGIQPPAGPMGLGGLFGGGVPTLPKNRGTRQRTGPKPPGSTPMLRSTGMSNGPVSVGMNNFNSNHMVDVPDIKGRPGPPPPPPSTTKPKVDFSSKTVNRNGHVSNGGIPDSVSDRIGGLNRSSQDFAAGIPRGNPPPPPPPPNRQSPGVTKPLRNSSTGLSNTNLPNSRPTSMSMVGRPLPPPPMPQQPQPPSSRPPSMGMPQPPQPPASKPPPPPVRMQPPPPVQSSLNIRSGYPPAPPQRTTSTMPGGTMGRTGRIPPPPPTRSQTTGISGPPTHGPPTHGPPTHGPPTHGPPTHGPPAHGPPTHGPPAHGPPTHGPPAPPSRKSGHYSGGYDDFEAKFKYHEMNELPPPEPFLNFNKTYPTKGSRRAPPPPPPH